MSLGSASLVSIEAPTIYGIDTLLPICKTAPVFHIGDVARKLRGREPIRKFAARAGVDPGAVSRFERTPSKSEQPTQERIAQALGYTLADLHALVPPTMTAPVIAPKLPSRRPAHGEADDTTAQTGASGSKQADDVEVLTEVARIAHELTEVITAYREGRQIRKRTTGGGGSR